MKRFRSGAQLCICLVLSCPLGAIASSFSRTDVISYEDNLSKWVIGQPKTSTNLETGLIESRVDYDPISSLPVRTYKFEKLQQTLTYLSSGLPATVSDGRDGPVFNTTVTFAGYQRGIPESIGFPDGTAESADVDDLGQILSVTDEGNNKTCYDYDPMGRVKKITYPSESAPGVCDATTWTPTTITFTGGNPAAYGLPAGQWRQTTLTGNGRHILIFDALWRPVVEQTLDLGNVSGTTKEIIKRYDTDGNLIFQSYPMNTVGKAVYSDSTLPGIHKFYDVLNRVRRVEEDSEFGTPIVTTTEYLTGFQTRVSDPLGKQTLTTIYQAYDEPTYDFPEGINHPEGAYTEVYRDIFGKTTALVRRNATSSVRETRRFVYNQYQELCKTVDPESGSTLQHFDGAGNVDWTAAGLNLPSFTSCDDTDASVGPRKIVRRYDLRNRLLSLSFPDGQGNQAWEYTLAGQPSKVTTYNTDVSTNNGTQVITSYGYFARGLLKLERLNQPGWYTWGLDYTYDSNAHLSTQTYPSGLIVDYKPNALGEPSQAGNSGPNPYAWGVKYYPNGAIASFSYGNAIRHSMTQNARGLPERSVDQNDSGVAVLDDSYDYDPNGNVAAISDGLASGRGDRTMTYDGLNRLTAVASPMYGAAGAHYAYDVLDNLTHVSVDGAQSRDQYFCYDTSTWRLTNIKTGSCLGATVLGLGYDEQGNVANKSGTVYDFDYGNRLRSASYAGTTLESYRYDGLGRRVLSYSPSLGNILSMYASDGRLIFQQNQRTGLNIDYIYLGGSLVARRERNNSTGIFANRYEHTDALGSPVAVTDGSQSVLERNEYEPYGKVIGASVKDGPGYTGHVADAQTGLDYMQQRYYDPSLGRFMSVDPVGVTETGANFNRFWYGNNNPYRFTDPDGRQSKDEGNFWVGFAKAIHDSIAPLANAMVDPDGTTIDPSTDQLGPGPGQVEQGGYKFGNALVIAETAKLPARVVGSVMPRAVTLTEGQAANLARFNKRLPKGNTGTVVTQGPKGSVTFTSEVPGKVPGSKATYQKTVNRAGETTGMTKTTVDNKGQVPHTKDKFSGSHG